MSDKYLVVMLFGSMGTNIVTAIVAVLNWRSNRREKSGNASTADANTVLANAQENRRGAMDLAKTWREAAESLAKRVAEQDQQIEILWKRDEEKSEIIYRLREEVRELKQQLAQGFCSMPDCEKRQGAST